MEALNKKLERLQQHKIRIEKRWQEDVEKIEREIAATHAQQQQTLYDSIKTLMPIDIDPMIVIGGLLSVFEQARTNPSTAEVWRQAGQKFRRQQSASKTSSSSRIISSRSAATQPLSATTSPLTATEQTSHHGD